MQVDKAAGLSTQSFWFAGSNPVSVTKVNMPSYSTLAERAGLDPVKDGFDSLTRHQIYARLVHAVETAGLKLVQDGFDSLIWHQDEVRHLDTRQKVVSYPK